MRLTIISDVKNNQQKFWNGKIYGTHVKVYTIHLQTVWQLIIREWYQYVMAWSKYFPPNIFAYIFFKRQCCTYLLLEESDHITLFVSTYFYSCNQTSILKCWKKTNLSPKDKIFVRLAVSQRIIIISYSL